MPLPTNIPKRLFQTSKTAKLSPIERAAQRNLQLLHPEWEYQFYDDDKIIDFVRKNFPDLFSVFVGFPRAIQRVDLFRYLVVYKFGGFYFDLDVFFSEPIDEVTPYSAVFPFEELTISRYLRDEMGIDWEIGNYGFGASANHPFLGAIIDNCVKAQTVSGWSDKMLHEVPSLWRKDYEVLYTTGPGLVTRTLAENAKFDSTVHVLFPDDVCSERNQHQFGRFGVHQMAASWRVKGGLFKRKLALMWESRRRATQLVSSRRLGGTRSYPRIQSTHALG